MFLRGIRLSRAGIPGGSARLRRQSRREKSPTILFGDYGFVAEFEKNFLA
jgi:hypothetical protein